MINRFKDWLGIEGVKLELLIPEEVDRAEGFVDGRLVFTSKNRQTISEVTVFLVERYKRGRGDEVKIDEYELGRISWDTTFIVPALEEVKLDFELPFTLKQSEIDEFANKNILTKGIAQAAKAFHQVKSTYKVIAKAKVKGTALHPFDERWILIK